MPTVVLACFMTLCGPRIVSIMAFTTLMSVGFKPRRFHLDNCKFFGHDTENCHTGFMTFCLACLTLIH